MAKTKHCISCGKKLHSNAKNCTSCGYSFKQSSKTAAVIGLLINILFWPGLGTIIGGDVDKGIAQMLLILVGVPLSFVLIGIPIVIATWVWALISSINQIERSD